MSKVSNTISKENTNQKLNDTFESIHCPVCDSEDQEIFISVKYGDLKQKKSLDYSLLGINKDTDLYVKRCKNCNFVFVNPRVKTEYEKLVYNECKKNQYKIKPHLVQCDSNGFSLASREKKVDHILTLLKVLNFVALKKELTLFDYGCGFGHTMSLAREFGMNVYGVDIDNERLSVCKELGFNVSLPNEFDSEFPSVKADIIFFQNCLEHVHDLDGVVGFLKSKCNDNAVLYVNGIHPRLIRIEERRKAFVKAHFIEHINYFPIKTLDLFLGRYGFDSLPDMHYQPAKTLKDVMKLFVKVSFPATIPYFTGFFERIYRYYEKF